MFILTEINIDFCCTFKQKGLYLRYNNKQTNKLKLTTMLLTVITIALIITVLTVIAIATTAIYFTYLNRKEDKRQKRYTDAFNRALRIEIYRDNAKAHGMPYDRAEKLLMSANAELINSRLI